MRRGAAALIALALSACTHSITLTPQDGVGPMGRGTAPGTLVSYHGTMSVELAGKTYAGDWTLQKGII